MHRNRKCSLLSENMAAQLEGRHACNSDTAVPKERHFMQMLGTLILSNKCGDALAVDRQAPNAFRNSGFVKTRRKCSTDSPNCIIQKYATARYATMQLG
jgi:hypothetical protein